MTYYVDNVEVDSETWVYPAKHGRWRGSTGVSPIKVNGASATTDDATTGKCHYVWTSGNVDTEGVYNAWFTVDGALAYPRLRIAILSTAPPTTQTNYPLAWFD